MKKRPFWRTLALVLMLVISTAFASDAVEFQTYMLDDFTAAMVKMGMLPEGTTNPEPEEADTGDTDLFDTDYHYNDLITVCVRNDLQAGVSSYQLSLDLYYASDDFPLEDVFAEFVIAFNDQAFTHEEALALIAELHEHPAEADEYGSAIQIIQGAYTYYQYVNDSDPEISLRISK